MKYFKFFLVLYLFLNACTSGTSEEKTVPVVLAYVTSWSSVIPDPTYITHIDYSFGHVNETFNGIRIDNEERLKTIVGLKKQKPNLKILLSIGGWGSGNFSEMAADETNRKAFVADCQRVITQFSLDGIDLDWEYPTSSQAKISSSPEDLENFTLLVRDIREVIGKDKLLTFASVATALYVDFKNVEPYIDFINIMSYVLGDPPYHNAGLYRSQYTLKTSVDESIVAHINTGVPANKLVLGIPFASKGIQGVRFQDIENIEGYNKEWDDVAKAAYLTNDEGEFVHTYEDVRSIAYKCEYLHEKGLLGAMYWQYAADDSLGTLRKAVYDGVMKR